MESAARDQQTAPRRSLLLIDDGWAAAATWDARLRTADDIIARAEADNRGVALMPLSETDARHFARRPPAPRACGSSSSSRSRTRVDRADALPAIARFLADAPDVELVWLSDGVDLGHGAEFVDGLDAHRRQPPAHRRRRRHRRPRMRSPPPTTPPAR